MALTPRLDLRQSQQLVMTPQLQQAIKLLQLSNLELTDFVLTEVEKNPLLDMDGDRADAAPSEPAEESSSETPREAEEPGDGVMSADESLSDTSKTAKENDSPLDTDFEENVFNHDGPTDSVSQDANGHDAPAGLSNLDIGGGSRMPDNATPFEQRMSETLSLRDHLSEQMAMVILEAEDRMIAGHLIDMVDDAGYLSEPPDDVPDRLGCTVEDVTRVLSALQQLEPAGVFARDLAECLALQLTEKDRYDPCMQALLQNLDLVAKRDFSALRKLCNVSADDLTDMILELQELNPKPGLAFGGEPIQPVVPDIFVRKSPAGTWSVELNTDTLPKVLVNAQYYMSLTSLAGSKNDKAYISECYANANWLVKALDQRARTILKVATELVKHQESFFSKGIRYLKPLNLRTIAENISMHESTVSRVTANKYIATERGIFEMKYFFNSAVGGSDTEDGHAAESVRHRIRQLIDGEKPEAILSDDKIVDILRGEDIEIARRTVAKYREAMRIPSSVERRRQKKLVC